MKQKNRLTLIIIALLLVALQLKAETSHGRFNLKEGDWFEIKVNSPLSFTDQENTWAKFFKGKETSEFSFQLRYELIKQKANGNQIYRLSIERIQGKMLANNFGVWMGYDSYYPPYQDSKNQKTSFIEYEMELQPDGNIAGFDSLTGELPMMNFDEINPRKNTTVGVFFSMPFPEELIKLASALYVFEPSQNSSKRISLVGGNEEIEIETKQYIAESTVDSYQIALNDSTEYVLKILKNSGVPLANGLAVLVDASFPFKGNTLIEGRLPDMVNRDVIISLEGDKDNRYFAEQHSRTNNEGVFSCELLLNEPMELNVKIGQRSFKAFLSPKDTLVVNELESNRERITHYGDMYNHAKKPGYMQTSTAFSGKAANNARLSHEMREWMVYYPLPKDVESFLSYQKLGFENINHLLELYEGMATAACLDYFRAKWQYYLAADKLYFLEEKQTKFYSGMDISYQEFDGGALNYPADFFLEVDTLPTIMSDYEWSKEYRSFVNYSRDFKRTRLSQSNGGKDKDFYSNYYFARAALKGWSLYNTLYEYLDKEIRNGTMEISEIEPFYNDFINNCNDLYLIERIKEVYKTASSISVGNAFPVQSLILADSTSFNLAMFKGKPVCFVLMKSEKKYISYYIKEMDKFEEELVNFVFVCLPNHYSDKSPADSTVLAKPNVYVIDLADQYLEDKLLKASMDKIFVLDKWLRIVDDNVESPINHFGSDDLEKTIQKAIKAKRFSRQQKTAFYKIAGWSLGSILFTFLIGIWIYRVRIRKLKTQETLKRQIKELEIKAIRSQMNPHFVFNALNSIQSLVNSNQYKETNIYLSKFSVLLRSVLNNSEKSMVSLAEELEAVKLYCELEQLRFEFELTFEVDTELDVDLIEIPGMIIQPLAENAVVHGLSPLGSKGELTIQIKKCSEGLCVTVSDNGVGLGPKQQDKLSQKGFGLKLVEERLQLMSYEKKQARLTVESNQKGKGTLATLVIPLA